MNLTCTIKSSINNRKELEVRNKALQYKKNKIQSKVWSEEPIKRRKIWVWSSRRSSTKRIKKSKSEVWSEEPIKNNKSSPKFEAKNL